MKALIDFPLPRLWIEGWDAMLPPGVTLDMVPTRSDEDLAQHAADAEILLTFSLPARRLALCPRVRFIERLGVGLEGIDVAAIAATGIPAAYTPGANAVAVAEHTILLVLALTKRFLAAEAYTRAGRSSPVGFNTEGINDLAGATVGLVGLGHIGKAVAERLRPFGSRLLYHTRHRVDAATEARLGVTHCGLAELLAASQIVSLHLPISQETRHIIGERELAMMPRGALLINTARGAHVDQDALRRAIEGGRLAGAGLDSVDPGPDGSNPFADLPQVIVTPHTGSLSRGGWNGIRDMAMANIARFVAGEPVTDLIPGTTEREPPAAGARCERTNAFHTAFH